MTVYTADRAAPQVFGHRRKRRRALVYLSHRPSLGACVRRAVHQAAAAKMLRNVSSHVVGR